MSLPKPSVWAVLNLTPDSFYTGSRVKSDEFVEKCIKCLNEGADVLDIGAESTRPFSNSISAEEEWTRLNQPLCDLKLSIGESEFFKRISIDTYKHETANKVLEMGVGCINDIRGGENVQLLKTVSEYNARIVLMHSKGSPKEMQIEPKYNDVVHEVLDFLKSRTDLALQQGILKTNIIWDCGIGFGKTLDHNLQLINNVETFNKDGFALMYAISRKSFIDKLLDIPQVELRRDPTMIIHTILAMHQVDILRVHDVAETVMIRNILKHIR